MPVPARLITRRLVLRRYRPEDAALLKPAIDESLDRLVPWMPWARHEPTPLAALAERLTTFGASFDAGTEWAMGIFDPVESRLLGGIGLHRRGPAHVLEIGYWIRTGEEGRGYVTEAVAALRQVAAAVPGISHVRICCDPRNRRSAAIPDRLGFTSLGITPRDDTEANADRRDTLTFEWTLTDQGQVGGIPDS
ncbi:MAG: GNAT family N-acetyltransferase [Gemmatimonadaceae bacterium]|nr:GNAT family N-acetyltransferase [Gemmatimonadaceae bacterium]